ncbi:MAG: hypothetical protein ACE5IL_12435 [Myxococcota bacterium]
MERARQIADEIAAHFGFLPKAPVDVDAEAGLFQSLHARLLAHYSFAGLTPTPTYLSLHLRDDRSRLIITIQDLSHTVDRTEIVRLLQADFERMFKGTFPHYEVGIQ